MDAVAAQPYLRFEHRRRATSPLRHLWINATSGSTPRLQVDEVTGSTSSCLCVNVIATPLHLSLTHGLWISLP
jgi:hypothetical protein